MTDIYVLDSDFNQIGVVDVFESFIWTDRFNDIGDFELYATINEESVSALANGAYISISDHDSIMVIEDLRIERDLETGAKLIASGRSLESILERRVIWPILTIDGTVQQAVETILNKHVVSPDDSKRAISCLDILAPSAADQAVFSEMLAKCQFTGDSVFDAVKALCDAFGVGFKMTLQDRRIKFQMYCVIDHSDETASPIVFSEEYDNLVNSSYLWSSKEYRNLAIVAGEDEGADRKSQMVYSEETEPAGLERRELFVDASDVQSKVYDDSDQKITLTPEQYQNLLKQRGYEKLEEKAVQTVFDGEADPGIQYIYGTDYKLGDIVTFDGGFQGAKSNVRVAEFIFSEDSNGIRSFPSFARIDEN